MPGGAPYAMGKAALEALAHTIAREERASGVHVNIVAPGLVDTEMGARLVRATTGLDDIRPLDPASPFGHVCTPQEVAEDRGFPCHLGLRERPADHRGRGNVLT